MDTDYISHCNDKLLVMVQVESPQGVEAIDEIANVKEIDMIFLGPMDLSCSIGKMGQFSDPEVKALLQQAKETVRDNHNVLPGGFCPPGQDLNEMFTDRGYSLVCGTVDMGLLQDAA